MPKVFKPGEPAPRSAIYDMVGPRGGKTGEQRVSTQAKPLPPTDRSGQGFTVATAAKHPNRK